MGTNHKNDSDNPGACACVEGWTSASYEYCAAIFFGHAANGLKSLEMSPTRRVKLFAPLDGVSWITSCNDDEGVYSCIFPVYIN